MNTSKTLEHQREPGGDYFILTYSRRSDLYLKDYLYKFNFDDYWCLKSTNHQRLISYEDFLNLEYSGYIFFKKDLYDIDNILDWIEWSKKNAGRAGIQYLNRPVPPFSPKKIIIKT